MSERTVELLTAILAEQRETREALGLILQALQKDQPTPPAADEDADQWPNPNVRPPDRCEVTSRFHADQIQLTWTVPKPAATEGHAEMYVRLRDWALQHPGAVW